ncbi:hypothetical protein IAD21_02218 [Abditibacteriota bacterium]|nr:hypothetical protein IAD21_02218 [Abditibacteriota bacterium]
MKPYSPVRDALWLGSVALVVLNKVWIKPHFSGAFWHSSLNDVMCLPVWMPIMVWLFARLRLRDSSPPRALEMVVCWAFWSVVFEVWLPHTMIFGRFAPGDPMDVLAYGGGGVVGLVWWEHWRRRAVKTIG